MGIAELLGSRWIILEHQESAGEVIDEVMAFIARGFRYCEPEDHT